MSPLLTVVTVVFNSRDDFLKTLQSVSQQTLRASFEYLVVDGGSTDGTVEAVRAAAERREVDRWVSEPDRGIYDAMNKAITMAQGNWVLFLNSGDVFAGTGVVEQARLAEVATELAYGACEQVYPDGGVHFTPCRPLDTAFEAMPCSHQSLFARRELLVGFPFDLRFKVAADHHFLARCLVARVSATRWDWPVARVELERYTWKQLAEGQRQKRDAVLDAGAPPAFRGFYARQTFALGLKHLVKKVLGASVARSLWRR